MSSEELEPKVKEALDAWDRARDEEDQIRGQYVASGPVDATGRLRWPEKIFDEAGIKAVQDAERRTEEAWDAYQKVSDEWLRSVGKK